MKTINIVLVAIMFIMIAIGSAQYPSNGWSSYPVYGYYGNSAYLNFYNPYYALYNPSGDIGGSSTYNYYNMQYNYRTFQGYGSYGYSYYGNPYRNY